VGLITSRSQVSEPVPKAFRIRSLSPHLLSFREREFFGTWQQALRLQTRKVFLDLYEEAVHLDVSQRSSFSWKHSLLEKLLAWGLVECVT
jgi:hypothetical protein